MTTGNPARLQQANQLLDSFRQAGRPKGAKPDQLRQLQLSPVGWPVTRDALAFQLADRLRGIHQPMQANTSYCGPAAFLYCLLEDRPDLYVAYAISMWQRAEYRVGTLDIEADHGTINELRGINVARARSATALISSLDWLTMASLSIATREWFVPGHSARADDVGRSITYPWVLKKWFAAFGMRPVHDSMHLGLAKSDMHDFIQAIHFWGRHWIVLQIDSSLISGGEPSTLRQRHWVVVDPHHRPLVRDTARQVSALGGIADKIVPVFYEGGMTWDETAVRDWKMDLRLFTWGREGTRTAVTTLRDVPPRFYGAIVFPRLR